MINYKIYFMLLLVAIGCEPAIEDSGVPNVYVNLEINLNDIDNAPLQMIGGFIYAQGGSRGIIVLRESQNNYKAFDRNCTYQPKDACAIVDMHSSGFYMEDDCCASTFNLSGFPTGGPAEFPLKEYSISLSGDLLFIFN